MKQLKCGIIGCGVIAPTHCQSFNRVDGVDIVWACDLIPEKTRALADRFNIPETTTDYAEVLSDPTVDIVSICTDHASHAEITKAAVAAGKHVICEKALAAHPEQLAAMVDAVKAHPECVSSGIFQHRFDHHYLYLKSLVDEGVFGKILTASAYVRCLRKDSYYQADPWRGTQEFEGGGVLINQAIHFLDSLLFVAGPVSELSARTANQTHADCIDVEDCVAAALQFENGALGTFEATSSSKKETWKNQISICGTEGSVTVENGKFTVVTCVDSDREERIKNDVQSLSETDVLSMAKDYYGPGHVGQIRDFVMAIREKRPSSVSLESAADTVRVVHAIYESSQSKAWVTVNP